MTKPTVLAPWANVANYPAGSEPEAGTPTTVAISASYENYGWRPRAKPPAQILNKWKNAVGQWVSWLNDGAGERVRPLDVSGGNYVAAVGVAVDGYLVPEGVSLWDGTTGILRPYHLPIDITRGERIKEVLTTVRCLSGSAWRLQMKVYKRDNTGNAPVLTQLGTTQTSAALPSGNNETLIVTGLTEEVPATRCSYYIEMSPYIPLGIAGAATDVLFTHAQVTVDNP